MNAINIIFIILCVSVTLNVALVWYAQNSFSYAENILTNANNQTELIKTICPEQLNAYMEFHKQDVNNVIIDFNKLKRSNE